MSDIRWDNLRNLAGFTLDQLEAKQHRQSEHHADLRDMGTTK